MDTIGLIKKAKWKLLGRWNHTGLGESLVSNAIVNPDGFAILPLSTSRYLIVNNRQMVPQEQFQRDVELVEKILSHDLVKTTGVFKKTINQSIKHLAVIRPLAPTAKSLASYFNAVSRHGRHWYEIMVIDSALQRLYPSSLPDNFKLGQTAFTAESLLAKVALPKKVFPIIKERSDVLDIAAEFKRKKDVLRKLKRHAAAYGWMNSLCWRSAPFTVEYYQDQVRELATRKPALERKMLQQQRVVQYREGESILKAMRVRYPQAWQYIDTIRDLADLKEDNWDVVAIAGTRFRSFFTKLAARYFVSYNQFMMLTADEMLRVIGGKLTIDYELLNHRLKTFAVLAQKNKTVAILTSQHIQRIEVQANSRVVRPKYLSGTTIWAGRVTGKVRVLNSVDDVGQMQRGEILVCPMTDPDYMPAIHKAKAIVTDQGGLLCHAAIVARELQIPCLVGTEVATKVFKTGHRIEVDATNGTVKKL